MSKIVRDPTTYHRLFWHLNPLPEGEQDIYHVAYIAKALFIKEPWHGAGTLDLERGTSMTAVCGPVGRYALDAGYILDGKARDHIADWLHPKAIICEACAFIEGRRLLTVPDDQWLRHDPPPPRPTTHRVGHRRRVVSSS